MGHNNGSGVLGKQQILDADDLKSDYVEVPEWGGRVRVRELTGLEREEFDATISTIKQQLGENGTSVEFHASKIRIALCMRAIIDDGGARIFTSELDMERLGAKSARALERVYTRAAQLSGLSKDEVEEVGKDSPIDQSAEPSSELPSE